MSRLGSWARMSTRRTRSSRPLVRSHEALWPCGQWPYLSFGHEALRPGPGPNHAHCGDPNLLRGKALVVAMRLVYQGVLYLHIYVLSSLFWLAIVLALCFNSMFRSLNCLRNCIFSYHTTNNSTVLFLMFALVLQLCRIWNKYWAIKLFHQTHMPSISHHVDHISRAVTLFYLHALSLYASADLTFLKTCNYSIDTTIHTSCCVLPKLLCHWIILSTYHTSLDIYAWC